jgi:hypothetical protein
MECEPSYCLAAQPRDQRRVRGQRHPSMQVSLEINIEPKVIYSSMLFNQVNVWSLVQSQRSLSNLN